MKAIEQNFPLVLYITLYKVVLTFEPVDEILKCDHSNESYRAVLSCGAVYYAVQGASSICVPIQRTVLSSNAVVMFIHNLQFEILENLSNLYLSPEIRRK